MIPFAAANSSGDRPSPWAVNTAWIAFIMFPLLPIALCAAYAEYFSIAAITSTTFCGSDFLDWMIELISLSA
ncbi:hypothetical protein [Mycolicibacterium chitae]|uniref:hypothetical protein n=1 Tax=Mycolicibacterium chitae TaxID=1792 RepID=UPI0011AE1951|nr:hypothetical protein [Mycolicibacterium chitae]MCV7108156.1 hypothetical protein [Mycolicibacterium chitae]